MDGLPCSPFINFNYGNKSLKLKTFFLQEMIKKDILMPWISISYSHGKLELSKTINAVYDSLKKIKLSIKLKKDFAIRGQTVRPIFK